VRSSAAGCSQLIAGPLDSSRESGEVEEREFSQLHFSPTVLRGAPIQLAFSPSPYLVAVGERWSNGSPALRTRTHARGRAAPLLAWGAGPGGADPLQCRPPAARRSAGHRTPPAGRRRRGVHGVAPGAPHRRACFTRTAFHGRRSEYSRSTGCGSLSNKRLHLAACRPAACGGGGRRPPRSVVVTARRPPVVA